MQKYRLYLRRLNESQQLQSINTPFMGSPDAGYGSMSSLNGIDLHGMAVGGQLPGQSLTTLQAAVLGCSNNPKSQISMPANQRSIFSFQDPNSRYGDVKTTQLLQGIPTNMEPNQFTGLHQSRQHLFNNVNSQILTGPSQTQNQSRQPVLPDGMLTHGSGMKVSGGGFIPNHNIFNNLNQIRPQDSSFQEGTFNNGLFYSCTKFPMSFSADDQSGTHCNSIVDNQDELLTAILKQVNFL